MRAFLKRIDAKFLDLKIYRMLLILQIICSSIMSEATRKRPSMTSCHLKSFAFEMDFVS